MEPTGPLPLVPKQLEDLRASGLTDETIRAAGLYRAVGRRVSELLRWDTDKENRLGCCLCIPYPDSKGNPIPLCGEEGAPAVGGDGVPLYFTRIKPGKPRAAKGRKGFSKCESPFGAAVPPYFPPKTIAALADPTQPLLFTEGEKKALKADQEGFPCIGLGGVDCWGKPRPSDDKGRKKGKQELGDELAAIPWENRQVYIVYDSDIVEKHGVQRAEWRLAQALSGRGADVKVVRLPAGDAGANGKPAKVGLDDFLVAKNPDALRELIAAAIVPEEPIPAKVAAAASAGVANEADDDPHRLARLFLCPGELPIGPAPAIKPEMLTLRYWREDWLEYKHQAYRVTPAKEVAARLTAKVKTVFDWLNKLDMEKWRADGGGESEDGKKKAGPPEARRVTTRLLGDVKQALAGITMLPASTQPPAWLDGSGPFPAEEVLATKNALVHLPSLIANKPPFSCPPSLNFFAFNTLDYDFRLDAPLSAGWLEFLSKLWPDDPGAIDLLQEWFGYNLLSDTSQQKILLIIGPKRSGKGTIARVLRALIGPDNVAGPTLSSLGTNFGLWPLLGKTAAVVSDARLSGGHRDQDVIVERLLSISGEDALTVDRKNMEPVTVKLPCRFTILTNELPRLGDSSGALPSRFLILHTPRSWFGKEDHGLTPRLLGELPGILLWAIEGWRRLRERGFFRQPESGDELAEEMEDLSSPVGAFIKECCEVGDEHKTVRGEVYKRFKGWCDGRGVKNPPTETTFVRDLLSACPTLRTRRPREGNRQRVYQGIKVIPADPADPFGSGGIPP